MESSTSDYALSNGARDLHDNRLINGDPGHIEEQKMKQQVQLILQIQKQLIQDMSQNQAEENWSEI